MPKSSTVLREDIPVTSRSGIRTRPAIEHRTTAKVPRVELDRLLAAERVHADLPEEFPELRVILKSPVTTLPPKAKRPTAFDAMRKARNEARLTRHLVVGIWAFAITLAGSLGYVIATHG